MTDRHDLERGFALAQAERREEREQALQRETESDERLAAALAAQQSAPHGRSK